MEVKVTRWGNSLGIRVPARMAERLRMHDGAVVELEIRDGELVIRRKDSLEELLDRITEENLHAEMDWGGPVGHETW